MTNDKELDEVWHKEFIDLAKSDCDTEVCSNGLFLSRHAELMFNGFLMAKRSQPSVVLPKEIQSIVMPSVFNAEDIYGAITAAGIKYTIGE